MAVLSTLNPATLRAIGASVIRIRVRDAAIQMPQFSASVVDYALQKLHFLQVCGVEDDAEQLQALVSGLRSEERQEYWTKPATSVADFLSRLPIPLGWTLRSPQMNYDVSALLITSIVTLVSAMKRSKVRLDMTLPAELTRLVYTRLQGNKRSQ